MIFNANCLDILPNIENYTDKEIILVTDPPFNIGYKYKSYKDNMKANEYYFMLDTVFHYFDKQVFIAYPEILYEFAARFKHAPKRVCSWVYNSNTPRQHRDVAFYGFEPDFNKYGQPYKNPNDKRVKKLIAAGKHARLYDWWNINQIKNVSKEKVNHPCQMPIEVMKNIIGCLPDDVCVVDPFCGSGTTGVACSLLGVEFIGIELDEDYAQIALERIEHA